jgi:hypothetical protein
MAGPADTVLLRRRAATANKLLTPDAYISRCSSGTANSSQNLFVVSREEAALGRGKDREPNILNMDAGSKECSVSKG